jgi:glycosyltransferase involved in cell wall biosynthesis
MYRDLRIAMVVPAYNEEKLIAKTVTTLPSFVDTIIVINDGSTDETSKIINNLAKKNKKVVPIHNDPNIGVGASLVVGFKEALALESDLVGVIAGDAQCNPTYIQGMVDTLLDHNLDYVKANRFVHLKDLEQMPKLRQFGNIFITLLGKFATGYYSIFDSQNGYGIFRRTTLEKLPLDRIGKRYDYENTLLIALSIMGARIKDVPVPAIYGEETSTIPLFKTATRALAVLWRGFWQRMYFKYVVVNFHPIALFLFSGILLTCFGLGFGLYILILKVTTGLSPSSGAVMLSVLPLILGFQLLLTTIVMDMNNEDRG